MNVHERVFLSSKHGHESQASSNCFDLIFFFVRHAPWAFLVQFGLRADVVLKMHLCRTPAGYLSASIAVLPNLRSLEGNRDALIMIAAVHNTKRGIKAKSC